VRILREKSDRVIKLAHTRQGSLPAVRRSMTSVGDVTARQQQQQVLMMMMMIARVSSSAASRRHWAAVDIQAAGAISIDRWSQLSYLPAWFVQAWLDGVRLFNNTSLEDCQRKLCGSAAYADHAL